MTAAHTIRATVDGWRCTCRRQLHNATADVARATAQQHAHRFDGTVEVAGFYKASEKAAS